MKREERTGIRMIVAILIVASILGPGVAGSQSHRAKGNIAHRTRVVFVCEHGAALSVVSAAYFNKLAQQRHLDLHAVARGTTPQKDLAVSAREGLERDGITFDGKRPQALSQEDLAGAILIVAFTPIPSRFSQTTPVETWSDVPPTGANYDLAREAILRHVRELISRMTPANK
ncbi:MAG: hypothetical protein WA672_14055 [Candidatus Angelobacter sp.]